MCATIELNGTMLFLASSITMVIWKKQQQQYATKNNLVAFFSNKTTTTFTTSNKVKPSLTKHQVQELRAKHFSKSLSVSYANSDPLMIVKGHKCRLVDEQGVSYLDTRNNVAHCGHQHPAIVQAIQEQVQQLNTNTRYLHVNMTLLAQRLIERVPTTTTVEVQSSLQQQQHEKDKRPHDFKVFFCNSGSEANDLALRLATAWAGGSRNTIVVDHAYHGHTMATLEVSPYKYQTSGEFELHSNPSSLSSTTTGHTFASPGRHIWQVPCPDTYRGLHRNPATAAKDYAAYVQDACRYYQSKGEKVRAFILEGGMSVAGVILPPKDYIQIAVQAVRDAGGLYIADEVQTGLGRFGTSFWAFEHDNDSVIPDIITVGKPFGNGMPLAAVIATNKVVEAFEKCHVEYFNTFAGNPVSAAAGLEVLDVIERESLQENAITSGTFLKEQLELMKHRVPLIGDVRGTGLFLGIEFVRDHDTLEPATQETSFLCSTLKSKYHVLTSIDGPHDNVFVIKPPMVFSLDDARYFLECLEQAITVDLATAGEMTVVSKTPT